MSADDHLRKLLEHSIFGRHVRKALWRRRFRAACLMLAVAGAALAGSEIYRLRSDAAAAADTPMAQVILDAAQSFPEGSPQLQSIASFAISAVVATAPEPTLKAAIIVVGRSQIGQQAEPWMRTMLAHPVRRIRREAVLWYPHTHPSFRSDPAAAAAYEAARSSLTNP